MCVGFWTLDHPDYALILCTNRDEYLSRPTTTAYWHSFEIPVSKRDSLEESNNSSNKGSVLSGRDLRAGGTWLGINRHGDVAFLTNITEDAQPFSSTRGELTSSFLLSDVRPQDLQTYLDGVTARNRQYAGFNLLLLAPRPSSSSNSFKSDASSGAYLTNHGGGGDLASRPLTASERRCGALSNGIDGLDADKWPKVQQGLGMFEDIPQAPVDDDNADLPLAETDLVESLFNLLTWRSPVTPAVRGDLRKTILVDPLKVPINSEETWIYGTRLSTVILVRRDGSATFIERDIWKLDSDGKPVKGDSVKGDRVHTFELTPRDN
ncbi:NRDE protein-domain-containing protein [Irpex lacteus]|nr:NRDE protein-domain-containing protein [Irpex lacteus]